jgi:Asp-tRNA(Asn)/Glu-tRNA(Gln) amidotransferase A subunit family amidase
MESVFKQVDVLLTPTVPTPAPKDLTTTGDPTFQAFWTNFGFPSISLPSGISSNSLPLAIQLVGKPYGDAELLSTATSCEQILDVKLVPPVVRELQET